MGREPPGHPEREHDLRAVAFLDVLGFADLVTKADEDEAQREVILIIIRTLRETLAKNPRVGLEFTQFSDSIVISANLNLYGIHAVFSACRMLVVNLIQRGILLRGGIAAGNLTHTEDVLFGVGLLLAYRCDARSAPPRIAIHSSMKEVVDDYAAEFRLRAQIGRDHWDLSPMLETLSEFAAYDAVARPGQACWDGPAEAIVRHIDRHSRDPRLAPEVRAKWRWMRDYWNRSVTGRGILAAAAGDEDD